MKPVNNDDMSPTLVGEQEFALLGGPPLRAEPVQNNWRQIMAMEKQAVMDLMDEGILAVRSGGESGSWRWDSRPSSASSTLWPAATARARCAKLLDRRADRLS